MKKNLHKMMEGSDLNNNSIELLEQAKEFFDLVNATNALDDQFYNALRKYCKDEDKAVDLYNEHIKSLMDTIRLLAVTFGSEATTKELLSMKHIVEDNLNEGKSNTITKTRFYC